MTRATRPSLLEIAQLVRPHGLKGCVFLRPSGGSTLVELAPPFAVYLRKNTEELSTRITKLSPTPKGWLAELENWVRFEDADPWRGATLAIERANSPAAEESEYYVEDLVGCRVLREETGLEVGELYGVEPVGSVASGAPDRWWIRSPSLDQPWCVPAVEQFVARVDLESREVWVRACDELME